jgi:RNA polymerase sigma-70 factor (ECF subfamily)
VTRSKTQEREWAEALIHRGDEAAFRGLYRLHTPRLYGFTLRLLGDATEAEDVVQETWVRAVRHLGGFRWRSALSTWLLGIGHNLCRERLRSRSRRQEREALVPVPAMATAPGGLRVDLERAIARLPDGCRAVLMLHDVEGWTHQEIGHRLGIAAGTSKSQLSEARRRLRSWLKRDLIQERISPQGAHHEA